MPPPAPPLLACDSIFSLVCVKTVVVFVVVVVVYIHVYIQARKLAAAASLQPRRVKTILRCENVLLEFISAWPWFIYSSEHRLAVAGYLTEMHSSAEGRCTCSAARTETCCHLAESRRISLDETVRVFRIQMVNQAGPLLDVDNRVS